MSTDYKIENRIEHKMHYTVSEIPDINTWRAEQEAKEEAFKAEEKARIARVVAAMGTDELVNKIYGKSEITEVMARAAWKSKRNKERSRAYDLDSRLYRAGEQIHSNRTTHNTLHNPTLIQKAYNWFLNLKFEV